MKVESVVARRWYQLHASSWFVLTLAIIALFVVNLPYEYDDAALVVSINMLLRWGGVDSDGGEQVLGGWPLRYLRIRTPSYTESPERTWSIFALAGDLLIGAALLATVVGGYEQRRRRRRMRRWQLSVSDLCLLMLIVCCVFGTWSMMAHRYRTQQSAMFQIQNEGGYVTTGIVLPKLIIGPEQAAPWRRHCHAWLVAQLWNHERPDSAMLPALNDESMAALRRLREITTLTVHDRRVTDKRVSELQSLRQIERLQIEGALLTDACIPSLQKMTRLRYLRIRDAQFSDEAITKLAALPELVSLDVEGTPLTDRGLAAIAARQGLRELNIARTHVTSAGLHVLNGHPSLTRLWLASPNSAPDAPGIKRLKLNDLPLLETLHLPSKMDALELENLPSLTQLPAPWEPNEVRQLHWFFSGSSLSVPRPAPFPRPMQNGVNAKHLSLRDMPGLKSLDLASREIESLELDVTTLEHLSTAGELPSRHYGATHIGYFVDDRLSELIGRNKLLQTLSLVDASLTHHGWRQLSSLRELRELDLAGSNVTDEDMAAFAEATKLHNLDLFETQISNDGFDQLPRLEQLQWLDVSGTRVTRLDLEGLSELTTLALADTPLESIRLVDLPELTGNIVINSPGPIVFEAVDLPMLGSIFLREQCVDRMTLESLPALTHLELAGSTVDDAMLINLGQWTALIRLDLGDTDITDVTLSRLGELPQLNEVDLENTAVTDEGLASLSPQLPLTTLNLTGTDVSDRGLRHLSGQQQLSHLYLGRTRVRGPGLQHLAKLTSLQNLSLGETEVTSESIAHLKELRNLNWLRLSDTKIDDAVFPHLNELRNLQHLYLNGTLLTDRGAETYNPPRTLKELGIGETSITRRGSSVIKGRTKVTWLKISR